MTREEAIKVLKEYRAMVMNCLEAETPAFDLAIESLSAETEWIPVSERLPSEERYYLCCNKGHLPFEAHYYGGQWHGFDGTTPRVDAWMPLPTPYGESEVEE